VFAAEVLHERVTGDDRLCGPVRAQAAHRSEPALQLDVLGLDPVVGIAFNAVPS
jgi:hypothetical protein